MKSIEYIHFEFDWIDIAAAVVVVPMMLICFKGVDAVRHFQFLLKLFLEKCSQKV